MKFRLLLLLAVLCGAASCDIFRHKREDPGPPPLLTAASSELVTTRFNAHTLATIDPEINQVYCATFALAWNTLIDSVMGEPIELGGVQATELTMATAEGLNERLFEAGYLDPMSYVALADFVGNFIEGRIREALFQTFGDAAPSPQFDVQDTLAVISYAYLLKRLDFEHVFTTIERPLRFNGDANQKVHAFGVEDDEKGSKAADMLGQVIVRGFDYSGPDTGPVVEITTKSDRDHLILAMVAPGATLQETWERVLVVDEEYSDHTLTTGVDFKVPKINFDLTHRYGELMYARVLNEPWDEDEYEIQEALQNIRFQLSERGAVLESSATIGMAPSSPPKSYIFDRPFLLAMIEGATSSIGPSCWR